MVNIRYVIKRLILYFITIWVAATIVFIIPRLIPGDPIRSLLTRMVSQGNVIPKGEELVREYRIKFGLDGDLFTQYVSYLAQILHGNLGLSIMAFPAPVQSMIFNRLPWTMGLLTSSIIVSWLLGNILGALLGWRGHSKSNLALISLCLFFSQLPYYLLAIILVLLLAYIVPIFPSSGGYSMWATPGLNIHFMFEVIYHSTLPALSLILVSLGGWAIGMRAMSITIQGEDYIMLAEAKGLRRSTILMKYAFRNALLPQVTGLALSLGNVTSGALLTEYIFAYPGIGTLFVTAVGMLDYNVLQGVLTVVIFTVVTANLIIDLLYPLVDPRIRYERK